MSGNNPHRFPRPPTLPQSKIQIQTQRDQRPADSNIPSFASMVGRATGGYAGIPKEKEDPSALGAFTTSFDLFSIAKMVPAKQRRVSNPPGINEPQASDVNSPGSLPENQNLSSDWRKQVESTTATEAPPRSPTPDIPKSMVFRRHGATSGVKTPHRSTDVFGSVQIKDIKDNQSTPIDEFAVWNEDLFFGDRSAYLRKAHFSSFSERMDGTFRVPDFSQGELSPKINTVQNFRFQIAPPDLLNFNSQESDDWSIKEKTKGHSNKDSKDILGITGKRMDPTAIFQPTKSKPATLPQDQSSPSTGFNQIFTPMTPLKNINDGVAVLRAAAVPFEPKQVSNVDPSAISGNQHEDNLYGKTFNPSTIGPPPSSFGSKAKASSKGQVKWRSEDIHTRLKLAIKNSRAETGSMRASGNFMHKKSNLGDAGISQLWRTSEDEDHKISPDESTGLVDASVFDPSEQTLLELGSNIGLASDQSFIEQDMNREPVVPIARNTPSSDLQIVERLELKALDISKNEIVAHEDFFEGYLQGQTIKMGPLPKVDQLGRRGAVSMQGTTEVRLGNLDPHGGGMPKVLTLEAQRKRFLEIEERKVWMKKFLEPPSNIEIRIRDADDNQETAKDWLYPYPKTESKETVTTELILAVYQQLLSYLVPPGLKEIRSEDDYWRFETVKGKSDCTPGEEPWYNGDYNSFFDMSFGVNSSHHGGNPTLSTPPGLSLVPLSHEQITAKQNKAISDELGGLRGLVESSTPDYSDYDLDYKGRAKTLQEWNSTPLCAHTPVKGINNVEASRKNGKNLGSWAGNLEIEDEEKTGGIKDQVSNKKTPGSNIIRQKSRSGSKLGASTNGSLEGAPGIGLCGNEFDGEDLRKRKEVFGGTKKPEKLVFGSDEGSE